MKNAICLFLSAITISLLSVSCSKDDDSKPSNQLKIGNGEKIDLKSAVLFCSGTFQEGSGIPNYEGNFINVILAGDGISVVNNELTGNGTVFGIYLFSNNLTELESGTYPYVLQEPYEIGKNWGFIYTLNFPNGETIQDSGSGTVIVKKISDTEYYIKLKDFQDQDGLKITLEYQGIMPSYIVN